MWKRGEIAPQEQFLLFSTLFYICISNFRSQVSYLFVKCGCSIYCFPNSLNSDCRGTDISKCFSEPLGIRYNESRLYLQRQRKFYSIESLCLLDWECRNMFHRSKLLQKFYHFEILILPLLIFLLLLLLLLFLILLLSKDPLLNASSKKNLTFLYKLKI